MSEKKVNLRYSHDQFKSLRENSTKEERENILNDLMERFSTLEDNEKTFHCLVRKSRIRLRNKKYSDNEQYKETLYNFNDALYIIDKLEKAGFSFGEV